MTWGTGMTRELVLQVSGELAHLDAFAFSRLILHS